mgnify:CR=1 FL=1
MVVEATYNTDSGWISVKFDGKPSREILNKLKRVGYRWKPKLKIWSASWTVDREDMAKEIAGKVRVIEKETDYVKKGKYYRERADKIMEQAREYSDRAEKLESVIPLGQPILIGHHSEKRHRRDLERIRNWTKKAMELREEAEKYERRAIKYEQLAREGEKPAKIKARVEKLEAEERKWQRELETIELEKKVGKSLSKYGIYTGDEDDMKRRLGHVGERLEIERRKYKESGGIPAERMVLKIGDVVNTKQGKAIIKKVSRKSVRVDFFNPALKAWVNYKIDKKDILARSNNTSKKMRYV